MAKKLIINADDFGVSEDINNGIMECYNNGAVTDISLLAVGDSFAHAVNLAKKHNITKVGIHLALTGEFNAVKPANRIPSLVDKRNKFMKSFPGLLGKFLAGRINKEEVYTELKAQILNVKKSGLGISHLDSHEHVHMFPPVLKIVLRLMREERIKYTRFPLEKISVKKRLADPVNTLRSMALYSMCILARKLLKKSHVKHNDSFIGHFHAHRLKRQDLFSSFSNIEEGLTELGCHPGHFGEKIAKLRPWYKDCEEELKVLCDTDFSNEIEKRSIELVSYSTCM